MSPSMALVPCKAITANAAVVARSARSARPRTTPQAPSAGAHGRDQAGGQHRQHEQGRDRQSSSAASLVASPPGHAGRAFSTAERLSHRGRTGPARGRPTGRRSRRSCAAVHRSRAPAATTAPIWVRCSMRDVAGMQRRLADHQHEPAPFLQADVGGARSGSASRRWRSRSWCAPSRARRSCPSSGTTRWRSARRCRPGIDLVGQRAQRGRRYVGLEATASGRPPWRSRDGSRSSAPAAFPAHGCRRPFPRRR